MDTAEISDRCACGYSKLQSEATCGHHQCEAHALGWGPLILRRDDGGWRHFLRGEPVACGSGLLLCSRNLADKPLHVRYESPLYVDREPPALLYTDVGGFEAVITAHGGMQLRWPHRGRW